MRAPISVVIPTLNAQETLPALARSLMEGLEAGLIAELIISDGGSSDDSFEIAQALGATWVTGPASRGGQLRRGCEAAQGRWLLVLHADTQLAPGWSRHVAEHLRTQKGGWGRLQFDQGGRFVAAWANWRAQIFGLPYGDQALLLPASLYHSVGGYPDQPLMEDVALARALKGQLICAGFTAITSAEKYRKQGWLRRGTRNLVTLTRYFLGADPARLAAFYRR
jgi:rSAM/selenodomain-associated transferase 2